MFNFNCVELRLVINRMIKYYIEFLFCMYYDFVIVYKYDDD